MKCKFVFKLLSCNVIICKFLNFIRIYYFSRNFGVCYLVYMCHVLVKYQDIHAKKIGNKAYKINKCIFEELTRRLAGTVYL